MSNRIEEVRFSSHGTEMAGQLILPNRTQNDALLPAILVVGPWLNVKEQVALQYAQRLANKGFAAFIFDFRYWGKSGGEPRQYESPEAKIADIHAALEVLASQPQIDPQRIGVLGVCFGVGYVAAASEDARIKSIAVVASWVHDVPSVTKLFGADEVKRRRQAGKEARNAHEHDGTVVYAPAASDSDKTAAMFSPDPDFYYNTSKRGAISEWTNRYAVLGWEEWLDFDGISNASKISQPLLVVHSDGSAFPDNAKRFFASAKGSKELLWMEGEHTQFYDTEPQISQAANAAAAHFSRTLLTPQEYLNRSQVALNGTHEFFAALEAGDISRFLDVWAEEGVQTMPYAPEGFPGRLDGKAAIEKQYGPLPKAFNGMRFFLRSIRPTADPNVVIAEFHGRIDLKAGGDYNNRYVGIFSFDSAGKLVEYAEYFDSRVLLQGFPGAAEMNRKALESGVSVSPK